MLNYFIHKRHGAISVMLAVVLIAALSFSSSLLEIGRYRSLQRLYKELTENAAFSLLGYYDRDLYENFGFLAIDSQVDMNEMLTSYLKQNLTGIGSGMTLNGADTLATGGSIKGNAAGLYTLDQMEVFEAQLMEFSAYRAPVWVVENALNIEDMIEALNEQLEEALPFLEAFQKGCSFIENFLDTLVKSVEYSYASAALQERIAEYGGKINNYNANLSALQDLNGEDDTTENHAERVDAAKNALAESAADLGETITELKKELVEFREKKMDFLDSFDQMMGAETGAIFADETAHTEDEETKELLEELNKSVEDGKEELNELVEEIQKIAESVLDEADDKLDKQLEELAKQPEEMKELETVKELAAASDFVVMLEVTAEFLSMIGSIIENIREAIGAVVETVKLIQAAFTGGVYDVEYNHTIAGEVVMQTVQNPYVSEDARIVSRQLEKMREVAESVGYDIDEILPVSEEPSSKLEDAVKSLQEAEERLKDMEEVSFLEGILNPLHTLRVVASAIKGVVDCIISFVKIFTGGIETWVKAVYQKLYAAVYASGMFPNRVTELDDDSRMNGSDFFKWSDYKDDDQCFVQAEAEYIFAGGNSETDNQTVTFYTMLMIRLLCNIPALLGDSEFMEILEGLASIPIVGWIVDVLLFIAMLVAEAYMDMIFMIYGGSTVDIIKTTGYLSLDGAGVEDMKNRIEDIREEMTTNIEAMAKRYAEEKAQEAESGETSEESGEASAESGETSEESGETSVAESKKENNELLEWGYQEHLTMMLTLFTPKREIYRRSATLIETDLRQKKAKSGEGEDFALSQMPTYVRVETEGAYTPLLPIPVIPGLNDNGIRIETMHYNGY